MSNGYPLATSVCSTAASRSRSVLLACLVALALGACGEDISVNQDQDEDGLTAEEEEAQGTDPLVADTDGDGIIDGREVNELGTDPTVADTDEDGLDDQRELELQTDPLDRDSDNGGIPDGQEVDFDRDPLDPVDDEDGDSDGIPDVDEEELGTDPAAVDTDEDGLDDYDEVIVEESDPLDPDSDDDGLQDGREVDIGTDPLSADSDGDGLSDAEEVDEFNTDPNVADTDEDGLTDTAEVEEHGTDPLDADSDADGLSDGAEINTHQTDALDDDSDDDGLGDGEEIDASTDPNDEDTDDDGLSDSDELNEHGTDPLLADTDEDGLSDSEEVNETDTNPNSKDSDDDGLTDAEEVNETETDPNVADSDGDGLSDREEVRQTGTDPLLADTDEDGLSDFEELEDYGTDPLVADTDEDGLNDGDEIAEGTDPFDQDSDGGGIRDGDEIEAGDDPLDPRDDNDADRDGLSDNFEEEVSGTDPNDEDSDDDGLTDYEELRQYDSNPLVVDTDEDGVDDAREVEAGSDPDDVDSDGDGLEDGEELDEYGTDPTLVDTDSDGLTDFNEIDAYSTDPLNPDTDTDTLNDGREVLAIGSTALAIDSDGDGLSDAEEFEIGTNPQRADTDGDGLSDIEEAENLPSSPLLEDTDDDGILDQYELNGTGPLDSYGATEPDNPDTDGDGLADGLELEYSSNPLSVDSDGDGLEDGTEALDLGTEPMIADTDDDGLSDGEEFEAGTALLDGDTDDDGLLDGAEVNGVESRPPGDREPQIFTSDPTVKDTDEDGLSDMQEVYRYGTDPRNPDTDGDGLTDQEEVSIGFDPLEAKDSEVDPDEDGLTSREEFDIGSNPKLADTDKDAAIDGDEVEAGSDPQLVDTDEDGLFDGAEIDANVDPLSLDTDGDGIADGDEPSPLTDSDGDGDVNAADVDSDDDQLSDDEELLTYGTDPLLADTDSDTMPDGWEVDNGLDPLDETDRSADSDGDGLRNDVEYRFRSDPTQKDTDGDGIPDNVEVAAGLNPADPADAGKDYDNDGISNLNEACPEGIVGDDCMGEATDINEGDSDGDGLSDSVDANPRDEDADGDGLTDGEETYLYDSDPGKADSDGDGVSDSEEVARGTTSSNPDSDGDSLRDAEENEAGTDPNVADTDGDGLSDSREVVTGVYAFAPGQEDRRQVFPDPLVADTDGDGLSDGEEAALGTDPTVKDTDGDGLNDREERDFDTDPFAEDSDGDDIPDGQDPSPLNRDGDGDSIPDARELVDGYNGRIHRTAGQSSVSKTFSLSGLPRGWFRVVVMAEPSTTKPEQSGNEPEVDISLSADGVNRTSTHALRWQGQRILSTAFARTTGDEVQVDVTTSSGSAQIDYVALEAFEEGGQRPVRGVKTLADRFDSDGDGLSDKDEVGAGFWADVDGESTYFPGTWKDLDDDGERDAGENSESYWLEAEHYANSSVTRLPNASANGGAVVQASAGQTVFSTGSAQWGYQPGTEYAVFIRGRVPSGNPLEVQSPGCEDEACPNYVWVTADRGDSSANDCGAGQQICATRVTLTNRMEWRYAGSWTPGDRFEVRVQELLQPDVPWELDSVAILPIEYEPQFDVEVDVSTIPADLRAYGVTSGTIPFDRDLPWGQTSGMNADTDEDGYRAQPINCDPDTTGCDGGVRPGTEGWLTDGHEALEVGTNPMNIDSDHDADLYPYDGGLWVGNGVIDDYTGTSGAPVANYTDPLDPWPVSLDADLDTLDNSLEEELWSACQPGYSGELTCPDPDATGLTCESTFVGTGLKCWAYDDDRDNDGIPDGLEDVNQNGIVDKGETDPNDRDTDGDGISDGVERGLDEPLSRNTAPTTLAGAFEPDQQPATTTDGTSTDTDNDSISDGDEDLNADGRHDPDSCAGQRSACGTRTVDVPGDSDTLQYSTPQRTRCETDASTNDTDGDGVSDDEEITVYCTDPNARDSDGDGLSDRREIGQTVTDPNSSDTDGDGLTDGEEIEPADPATPRTDPLDSDSDDDGLTDDEEINGATPSNPTLADSDGDGLTDREEVQDYNTDPLASDTDRDGLTDFYEIFGEDRNRNGELDEGEDSDGDGELTVVDGTDPNEADSDGDGFYDGEEVRSGSEPGDETSEPSAIGGANGGVEIDLTDGDVDVERDEDGNATGLITQTGEQIELKCPGRNVTAYLDGTIEVDRTGTDSTITANGDLYARRLGEEPKQVFSGPIDFITPSEAENSADASAYQVSIAYPRFEEASGSTDFLTFSMEENENDGKTAVYDVAYDTEWFLDICSGDLGGQASARFSVSGIGDAWALDFSGDMAVNFLNYGASLDGRMAFETPVGRVPMATAGVEVRLIDLFFGGEGRLVLPEGFELFNVFNSDSDEADYEPSATEGSFCAGCLEFEIDPSNGYLDFYAGAGQRPGMGPFTGPYGLSFTVDLRRMYIYMGAAFKYGIPGAGPAVASATGGQAEGGSSISFQASLQADLSGQLEYESNVASLLGKTCSSDQDCLFGQECNDGRCQGCAAQFEPRLLDRHRISMRDDGEAGDTYAVTIDGEFYSCPRPSGLCTDSELILEEEVNETFEVVHNGRYDVEELAEQMQYEINKRAATRCEPVCQNNYWDCAQIDCAAECSSVRFPGFIPGLTPESMADFGVPQGCIDCSQSSCGSDLSSCRSSCVDELRVEAFADGRNVTVEADSQLFDFDVTTSYNGDTSNPAIGNSLEETINGHIDALGSVSVPFWAAPPLSLKMKGSVFADLSPEKVSATSDYSWIPSDNDPMVLGVQGKVSVVVLSVLPVEMGETEGLISYDFDGPRYGYFGTSSGMRIEDVTGKLPLNIGAIGQGQRQLIGLDFNELIMCGEGDFALRGFTFPWAWQIDMPFDVERTAGPDGQPIITDAEYAPENGRIKGGFGIELPLGVGRATGYGEIDLDGDFSFAAEVNSQLLGYNLSNATFIIDNESSRLEGYVDLPFSFGQLAASGEFRYDGTFDLGLSGNMEVRGFELANVEGSFSNDGMDIESTIQLPGNLGSAEVSGWVREDGEFHFRGEADLNLPNGASLADAKITLSSNGGLSVRAGLSIPGVTNVQVSGTISSSGFVNLEGRGSLDVGPLSIGPVSLEFTRLVNGDISISGSGSLSISGHRIVGMNFNLSTDGSFSASGEIDLWVAKASAEINVTAGGSVSLEASASIDLSAAGHDFEGAVEVAYERSTLSFEAQGSVSGPIANFSLSASVDSNGCFRVADVAKFCI